MSLTRKVTVEQPVTGVIADLVYFVKSLEGKGIITFAEPRSENDLVSYAIEFWDTQHGDD